jgi:hypothetical protein
MGNDNTITFGSNVLQMTKGITHINKNTVSGFDFAETDAYEAIQWTASNYSFIGTTAPKFRLESKGLALTNGASVGTWGEMSQSTDAYKPTLYTSGGYQNGAYVKGVGQGSASGQWLSASSVALNCSTNGGITVAVLARYEGTAANNEPLWSFPHSSGNAFMLFARSGTTSGMFIDVRNVPSTGTVTDTLSAPAGTIVQNEWVVFTFIQGATAGNLKAIYKNGVVVASGFASSTLPNITVDAYLWRPAYGAHSYANASIAAYFAYDRLLSATEFQALHSYLMMGCAQLNGRYTNIMAVSPFTRVDGGALCHPPIGQLELNSITRVHALPTNPLFVVDVNTPLSFFKNTTNLPTFDKVDGSILFSNVDGSGNNYTATGGVPSASGQYLNLPLYTYNIATVGLTIVMRMRFVSAAVFNRSFEYPFAAWGSGKNGTFGLIRNSTSTSDLQFFIFNPSTTASVMVLNTSTANFTLDQTFTATARYDPYNKQVSVWYNDTQVAVTTYETVSNLADRTPIGSAIGYGYDSAMFHGRMYALAVYNRALTDDEIRLAHNVMSYDTPNRTLEIGTRTGNQNTSLVLQSDGNVGIGTTNPQFKFDMVGNLKLVGSFVRQALLNSVKMWWDFENVSGSVVPDISGNGNTGTITGTGYSILTSTVNNKSIKSFRITSDASTTLAASFAPVAGAKTISFWAKSFRSAAINADLAIGFFLPSAAPTSGRYFAMMWNPYILIPMADLGFMGYQNEYTLYSTTFSWTTSEWVHITLTMDVSYSCQVYVNGAPIGIYYGYSIPFAVNGRWYHNKLPNDATPSNALFRIRSWSTTTALTSQYEFRNVMYFDRCLTTPEITMLYNIT